MSGLVLAGAVMLDWWLGEPRRRHPLVGFGRLAEACERACYGSAASTPRARRRRGLLAWTVLVIPPTAVVAALPEAWSAASGLLALYFALGHRSLHDHARAVTGALVSGDEEAARRHAGYMVSRDSAALDIPGAVTESVLENGSDGVFGALFWFVVAGAPGAILFRLANTLDAMWGYRNERYNHFGWAAARLDDLLSFLPARFTALSYTLLGNTRRALVCWRHQAPAWESPNAGPVMASGAGALGLTLGGAACYRGEWHQRPVLGCGPAATVADIERALALVRHSVILWVVLLLCGAWLHA